PARARLRRRLPNAPRLRAPRPQLALPEREDGLPARPHHRAGADRGGVRLPARLAGGAAERPRGDVGAGRLTVQLPAESATFTTWDFPLARSPNRGWRRWGTQKLVDIVKQIAADYAARFPGSARLVVGDLSRTHSGPFGREYGGLGHG